jgi:hypothetical protein
VEAADRHAAPRVDGSVTVSMRGGPSPPVSSAV